MVIFLQTIFLQKMSLQRMFLLKMPGQKVLLFHG